MRIKGIRHACIMVTDVNRMVQFYQELGMKVVRDRIEYGEYISNSMGLNFAYAHVIYLEAQDGSLLELLRIINYDEDYHHVSFSVEGLEAAFESPYNKVKARFIKDPEGNWMECVEEI